MHQENLQHGLKKSMSPSQWDITIYFLFSFVLLSLRFIKHLPFLFSFARFFCPLVLTSSRSCCTVCTSAHSATAMISKGLINTRHFHVHYHDHYLIVVEIFIYIYIFSGVGGFVPGRVSHGKSFESLFVWFLTQDQIVWAPVSCRGAGLNDVSPLGQIRAKTDK